MGGNTLTTKAAAIRKLFASICMVFLLTSCITTAKNVQSVNEVKDNNKILAGRFVFYNNDKIITDYNDYRVIFRKQGSSERQRFQPDKDGYVYVAIPVGQYHIDTIEVTQIVGGTFEFALNPLPTIEIKADDATVNFGTIEARFYQTEGSKAAAFFVGFAKAHLKISHIPDFDNTRAKIMSKIADFSGTPVDRSVQFIERTKKAERD
jgi:hypothetical protein